MSVSVSKDVCGEDCNVSNKAQLVPTSLSACVCLLPVREGCDRKGEIEWQD